MTRNQMFALWYLVTGATWCITSFMFENKYLAVVEFLWGCAMFVVSLHYIKKEE